MLRFCREKCCGEVLEEFRAEVLRETVAEKRSFSRSLEARHAKKLERNAKARHVKTKQR